MPDFAALLARGDLALRGLLGESVTYSPGSGTPVTVTGVFDQEYVLVEPGAHAGVSSSGPAVFLTLADLPSDPSVDTPTLTIRGVTYSVRESKPDGFGAVLILLIR